MTSALATNMKQDRDKAPFCVPIFQVTFPGRFRNPGSSGGGSTQRGGLPVHTNDGGTAGSPINRTGEGRRVGARVITAAW